MHLRACVGRKGDGAGSPLLPANDRRGGGAAHCDDVDPWDLATKWEDGTAGPTTVRGSKDGKQPSIQKLVAGTCGRRVAEGAEEQETTTISSRRRPMMSHTGDNDVARAISHVQRVETEVGESGLRTSDRQVPTHALVGGTRILARHAHKFEAIVADLRETASRLAGLELRVPRCMRSPLQRRGQDASELRATRSTHPDSVAVQQLPPRQCLRMLGASVQCDGARTGSSQTWYGKRTMPRKTQAHKRPPSTEGTSQASQCLPCVGMVRG